jgi:L-seryl-tRNA(Ser) seleniumtransferase
VKALSKSELYRKLPSVDELMRHSDISELVAQEGRVLVLHAVRTVLNRLRGEIQTAHLDSTGIDLVLAGLPGAVDMELRRSTAFSLEPVINATGVILHTNLGRAPLARSAVDHIREIAEGYSSLELELQSGARGKRDVHVDRLFQTLLGAAVTGEGAGWGISTIVVNNNAAAVWLALNTLAAGGEVIVSRGELVEIGGSFRIPDVMAQSNGILREVGTTNRTRVADYERAITDKTKLLLRVHRSNFQITGFTEQPALEDLVALGRERSIPVVEDLGSGALFDLVSVGIHGEKGVGESLRAGVDVVTYSGDKLLGGPQAGMLSGRADLIGRMRANSLFRALRVDKLTYSALEATLLAYVKGDYDAIPALNMMRLSRADVGARAQAVAGALRMLPGLKVEVIDGESVIGGGAAPSAVLPTRLLALAVDDRGADDFLAQLRGATPPVIARVEDDRVVLDLRTVFPSQQEALVKAIRDAVNRTGWAPHP